MPRLFPSLKLFDSLHAGKAAVRTFFCGGCAGIALITALFTALSAFSGSVHGRPTPALRVVVDQDNAPYSSAAGSAATPAGFEVDLIKELVSRIGRTVTFKALNFPELIAEVKSKKVDMAVGSISITPSRKKECEFSRPYVTTKFVFVSSSDQNIQGVFDLFKKRIAVQSGSVCAGVVNPSYMQSLGVTLLPLHSTKEMLQELREGQVDLVVLESQQAAAAVEQSGGAFKVAFAVPPSLHPASEIAIVFPKDSPLVAKVDDALAKMREDGSLDALIKKWLPAEH